MKRFKPTDTKDLNALLATTRRIVARRFLRKHNIMRTSEACQELQMAIDLLQRELKGAISAKPRHR